MFEEKHSILVVDDDEQIADILSLRLEADGYRVDVCDTIDRAAALLRAKQYSLVLLDLRLRDENGIESLPRLRDIDGGVPIFIITAHGDVDSAVKAFSRGANGFIRKPFQEGDLRLQISQAVESYHVKLEVRRVQAEQARQPGNTGPGAEGRELLYRDPIMRRFVDQVAVASRTSSNVVISGASGTGKELVARALHSQGSRAAGPFVAINCGALPENLLESELFGYVRGAFTDARENKSGLIVRANGGTLFLDEIGDAPLPIQIKLLRVLQEREVLPVGAAQPVKVDVRVIVATHRDLKTLVAEGRFREDLFYRLHVLPLNVPALKERRQDIVYLANVFANRFAAELGKKIDGFTASALAALQAYEWPGNVRELQNRVEHAVVMGRGPVIGSVDLFPEYPNGFPGLFDAIPTQSADPLESCGQVLSPMEFPPTVDSETSEIGEEPEDEVLDDGVPAGQEAPGPLNASADPYQIPTYKEAKEDFERRYIQTILKYAHGNIARAARLAGKYRTEVYGLIRKYSLDPREFKQN